jgi:two-component system, sensor histidine kinase
METSTAIRSVLPLSDAPKAHPRVIGWWQTTALAMGGSNQSLFLIGALFVGSESIPGQGSAAVLLLIFGLLLSWAAAPGWLELVLMFPNRVGGIAATCSEAFKPYSPVVANLTGVCYWWGWVPTCGLTALLSGAAIHAWYFPWLPVQAIAIGIVVCFTAVNLWGVKWAGRLALPIAFVSASLAFVSALAPVLAGRVDWRQATSFHLTLPFSGWFGVVTSTMAGLYLVGFAAPAFEAATCHVGETIEPEKNVPRAVLASALMAGVYFVVLPIIWLGALGPAKMANDLILTLGPTFAPIFGSAAKSAALGFMMFNMLHGSLQPLAGASRTLSQLADDGLLPEVLGWRSRTDAPWVATILTASVSIVFLLMGDPLWLIASANFTYLISIGMPSIAVWLLRGDQPRLARPYRAPRGTIVLGFAAAIVWGLSAVLGFQQFGLPTVLIGLGFAYSGSILYAYRKYSDCRKAGLPWLWGGLHFKLTGAMLLVLLLDGIGYFLAVQSINSTHSAQISALEDIFVTVAILTIAVGLVLPGIIAHSAEEVSKAAHRLATGTLADFSRAMLALGRGDLSGAHTRIDIEPLAVTSKDEIGEMASSFNVLQREVVTASEGLDSAREGLAAARSELTESNEKLKLRVQELATLLLEREKAEATLRHAKETAEAADRSKSEFLAVMSHEIRTPMNGVLGFASIMLNTKLDAEQRSHMETISRSGESLMVIINDILDFAKIEAGKYDLEKQPFDLRLCVEETISLCISPAKKGLEVEVFVEPDVPPWIVGDVSRVRQILVNLLGNAVKFSPTGRVTVRVRNVSDARLAPQCLLQVDVIDTGIGIPAGKISSLFKPFSQVDSSTTRTYGGTGLGLAICRNLIELMGGKIWVESTFGQGSTFSFTLPAVVAATSARSPVDEPFLAKGLDRALDAPPAELVRILVVEDVHINRILTLRLLSDLGYNADTVANGLECLEIMHSKTYDIIFMDIQMPEMDGFTATQRIRAAGDKLSASPPYICALTANIFPKDVAACYAAGMDDLVPKPLRREALKEALHRAHYYLESQIATNASKISPAVA